MPLIKVLRWGIFLRRLVNSDQLIHAALFCLGNQLHEKGRLNRSADHPATEKKRIDLQQTSPPPKNRNPNTPITAEAVDALNGNPAGSGTGNDLMELPLGVSAGCQIKLIRLLREL